MTSSGDDKKKTYYGSIKVDNDFNDDGHNQSSSAWVVEEVPDDEEPLLGADVNRKPFCCGFFVTVANAWTALIFGWFSPVLEIVKEKLSMGESPELENVPGIPPLPHDDSTKHLTRTFERLWSKEQAESEKPSLVKCLWVVVFPMFLQAGCLKFVHDCLQFVGPQVLNRLILFFRKPTETVTEGILLTLAVTAAQLLMSLCLRHYFFKCYRVGLRVRTCVLLEIFKKSLRIDSSYYQKHPIGQVTNLMSVDVQRLQDVISYLHAIWYSFLQIGLALYFLWEQLGPSCLAGVAVILASIPLTATTAKWMGGLQKKVMKRKDDRVQTNQETVMNMKVVKLQAWEVPFSEKVKELRRLEIRQLLHYSLAQACTWLLWSGVPLLIALFTFGAYVTIAGQVLDVASALTALALFQILRFPLFMLPYVINMIVEAGVALERIGDFLNAPDHIPPLALPPSEEGGGSVIKVSDASFSYERLDPSPQIGNKDKKLSPEEELLQKDKELILMKAKLLAAEEHVAELKGQPIHKNYGSTNSMDNKKLDEEGEESDDLPSPEKLLCLRRINLEFRQGEFIAVVGGVGCGKSTLLRSILGEVQTVSGDVQVGGKVAYFDQKAFIMNDTVKGNILFGKPDNNPELYRLAIDSCALEHDLTLLPEGDQCEIGERGITLSGGQKARIALARAVYHDADITLLDDCLSAVDAHVGRSLFDDCIVKVLLEGKNKMGGNKRGTVLLVTNALQYLSHPSLDRIVVMKHGLVVESGSYKELLDRESSHFKSFLSAFNESMAGDYSTDGAEEFDGEGLVDDDDDDDTPFANRSSSIAASRRRSSVKVESDAAVKDKKPANKLMTDEMAEREIGRIGKEIYLTWARAAGGVWVLIPLLLVFSLREFLSIFSNWWLTYWSHAALPDPESQLHFLAIYGLINISAIVGDLMRTLTILFLGLKASTSLFSALLDSTMHAPMSFFDTTPAGRIMNRFSKDVYTLDEGLPASFRMYLNCLFQVTSTLVVVTSVTPVFAVVLVPVLYFYRLQQAYFSQCYRELKRIDSVTRSPIYALFGETLDGPATIRAFQAQQPLLMRMVGLVDKQQHAYFLTQSGLCWLAVRLELIGTTIVAATCAAAVYEKTSFPMGDEVFAGLAGLSISYGLSVTQALNWAVRVGSDFEANMVSVERIRQYCNLESEAAHETDQDDKLGKDWPSGGELEFCDAKLRYRSGLPLVLKGLNIRIPGQSKVGIVGRTGAGKSTLMTALMRLVELDGGKILMDGVDTSKLGLRRLRSSIAVIPQDPVLFSGTVRTNLDPFDNHTEDELQDVLERVGLWNSDGPSAIASVGDKVLQDGSNFSVGQRQLLVIARALLDGAGVVICDEATAAIDAEADQRIQKVLRTDFANATTLTVAHRLNTIMDSTHILCMADGKAVEFDTPSRLLQKGGFFKDLVDKWEEEN